MSFGGRVWGPTGLLELDENSFTVRIIYSAMVSRANASGRTQFISIPGVNPATHSAVCIPIATYDTSGQSVTAIQYTPVIGTDGVTIYFGSPAASTGPVGTSAQRLLVMRYR